MKRAYSLFTLIFLTFAAAFTVGVLAASGEEGDRSGNPDPWFSVKQQYTLKNAMSLAVTYGDLTRGCRCFPVSDEVRDGSCPGSNHAGSNAADPANYCSDGNSETAKEGSRPGITCNGPDCNETVVITFPGDDHADTGEFWGLFDWMENVIEQMFRDRLDLLFPVLQTLLCGTSVAMRDSSFGSDLCLVLGDTQSSGCFGRTNDDVMVWANRVAAKIFFVQTNQSGGNLPSPPGSRIRAVLGLYNVAQEYDRCGNGGSISDGTTGQFGEKVGCSDNPLRWNPPGTGSYLYIPLNNQAESGSGCSFNNSAAGVAGSSEVCVETFIHLENGGGYDGQAQILTDAMLIRMDIEMMLKPNPITLDNSLLDLCVTGAQIDFKGAQLYGNLGSVNLNCDLEEGCDGHQMMDAEAMPELSALVRDMVNGILHGDCPNMVHYCTPYTTTKFGTGSGCTGQLNACYRSSYGGGNSSACSHCTSCDIGMTQFCNIQAFTSEHIVSTGIPPIDKWLDKTDYQDDTGVGACSYGIFPVDLNNMLSKYQPFGLNLPGYDAQSPNYGTLEMGGNTFDMGIFIQSVFPNEGSPVNRIRMDFDVAIRPRWSDYWGCIDTQEMGLPQYTRPYQMPPSGSGAFTEPGPGDAPNANTSYMVGVAVSEDFFAELVNVLFSANFFCWDINKDNIFSMFNLATSTTGAAGGFSFNALGELFHVPAFAALAPGVEFVADGDGYASVKLVPAGAPSARTGVGTYTYPVEYLEDIMPQLSNPKAGGLKAECYDDRVSKYASPVSTFVKFAGILGAYDTTPPGNQAVSINYNWAASGPSCMTSDSTQGYKDGKVVTNPVYTTLTDHFSVIWTGYVMAPFTGTYTFCLATNDGGRLFIDNKSVVNVWADKSNPTCAELAAGTQSGYTICNPAYLTEGLHPIRMEYYDNTGDAVARLMWWTATLNPYGIPNSISNPGCETTNVVSSTYLYSSGVAADVYSDTYDVQIKMPSTRFEVWAPLDDKTPGVVTNEPVRLFSIEAFLSIGLDLEFIRNQVKTVRYWGWDQNAGNIGSMKLGSYYDFFRIFMEIHPDLVDIKYAADQRLSRAQMENAVSAIFTSITTGYLQAVIDTKLDIGAVMGLFLPGTPGQDVGLLFRSIGPGGTTGSALKSSNPPYWSADSAPDYLAVYLYFGKDTQLSFDAMEGILPMVSSFLAPRSPMGPSLPMLQSLFRGGNGKTVETESPVLTYLHAPAGIFFENEPDPLWSRGYALDPAQSLAAGFGQKDGQIGFVGYDYRGTDLRELRYSTRFDGGLWGIPRYTQKLKLPPLLEGKHTFEVMAIAPDGMADAEPARLDFTVDTQPPRVSLVNGQDEKTFVTGENPVFTVNVWDFQTQPEDIRIAYRLDGGEITDNGFSKVIRLSNLSPPAHKIEILAQDASGNVSGISNEFLVSSGQGGFGCGTFASGGVNQVGTILVIIFLISLPVMLIIFLKIYYREKEEQRIKGGK